MWRFANQVYRAFRNTATHRCQQDILLPLPTACNTDDEENSNRKTETTPGINVKYDIRDVLKHNQFSKPDLEKIQTCLTNFAFQQFANHCTRKQISNVSNETVETTPSHPVLPTDETCLKTIRDLSEIQQQTLSEIHLQSALDAFDAGDYVRGVQSLHTSVQSGRNAAALYNLGLCYEEGLGVEENRGKACEYYRQASALGHVNAQLNLTSLSNQIDLHDDDGDGEESVSTTKDLSRTPPAAFQRFEWIDPCDEDLSVTGYSMNWKISTVAY